MLPEYAICNSTELSNKDLIDFYYTKNLCPVTGLKFIWDCKSLKGHNKFKQVRVELGLTQAETVSLELCFRYGHFAFLWVS